MASHQNQRSSDKEPGELESIRIDKWLWAVRLFKTRSEAAEACQGGHVEVNGRSAKPSTNVRAGDEISARRSGLVRVVKILSVLEKRIGAALVPEYYEDRTPEENHERAREQRAQASAFAQSWKSSKDGRKGRGRPTKKDARIIRSFFE